MKTISYTYNCDGANCKNSTPQLDATWKTIPAPATGGMPMGMPGQPQNLFCFCADCSAKTTVDDVVVLQKNYAAQLAAARQAAFAAARPAAPVTPAAK